VAAPFRVGVLLIRSRPPLRAKMYPTPRVLARDRRRILTLSMSTRPLLHGWSPVSASTAMQWADSCRIWRGGFWSEGPLQVDPGICTQTRIRHVAHRMLRTLQCADHVRRKAGVASSRRACGTGALRCVSDSKLRRCVSVRPCAAAEPSSLTSVTRRRNALPGQLTGRLFS
jgi:hypothetical protein